MTNNIILSSKTDTIARDNWNKLGFIAPIVIDIIDRLKDTNAYEKQLKFHLNQGLKLLEKVSDKHSSAYQNYGEIQQPDGDLAPIHSRDVYNITAKAYEVLFMIFTEKSPSEICCIAQLISTAYEKGIDLTQIEIPYEKLK